MFVRLEFIYIFFVTCETHDRVDFIYMTLNKSAFTPKIKES